MMIYESCWLLVLPESSQRSFWNALEHSSAFWWESQICHCSRSCQLYPDFQLYWGLNATSILQYHPLHLSLSLRLLSTLAQQQEQCQGATTSNATQGERQRDRERDRWRKRQRITVWVEIWLCIKAKLRGKNFLLNWLYIHEKRNHNVSLPLSLAVFVCLMVPTVYTLPVSTFTHCYQSRLCGIKSSIPLRFLCWEAVCIYPATTLTPYCK